jgi:hypothetical protein
MLNLYSYFEGVDDEIKARGNRIDQAGKIAKQAREDELYKTLLPLTQSNTELSLATNKLALGENGLNLQRQGENIANFHANADLRAQNQQLLRQTEAYRQKLGLADIGARQSLAPKTMETNAITAANAATQANVDAVANTGLINAYGNKETRRKAVDLFNFNPEAGVAFMQGLGVNIERTKDGQGVILNGQPIVNEDYTLLASDPVGFAKMRVDAANKANVAEIRSPYTNGKTDGTATTTPQPVGTVTRNILNPTQATTPPVKPTVANPKAVQDRLNQAGVTNADTAKQTAVAVPANAALVAAPAPAASAPPAAAPTPPQQPAVAKQPAVINEVDSWIKPEYRSMAAEIQTAKNELIKAAQNGNATQQISAAQKVQKLTNVLDFSLAGMQDGLAIRIKTRLGL